MRTRLAHTLTIWLLSAVALSVLAMGGLMAWHLREGFGAYLQARDLERLDRLASLLAVRLADTPTDLRRPDMPGLMRELAAQEGAPRPAGGPLARSRHPDGQGDEHRPGPPPGIGGGAGGGLGGGFGARVSLLKPDGQRWAGPPPPPSAQGVVERPVKVDGVMVARLLLRPAPPVPDGIEVQFLRSQYWGIAVLAAALMLLAWAGAVWLARQWTRPLAAVQDATARIAQGALDVRVPGKRGDEIGDVVRNVNIMAESLQRLEGARRRWLADLSHELRTPLTVLRGEIEALVDGIRQPNAAAMLSLREDVLRLNSLVDDLHLLAMADLQALPCHPIPLDAVALLDKEVQRHQHMADERGLTLRWSGAPMPELAVTWDPLRVAQLIGNLLQNSLRYTDAPGQILVGMLLQQGRVLLCIEDSAPGVPSASLPRLFDPLYRADTARDRYNGGSGLGLAICAAIAAAHGGYMHAAASASGGLKVLLDLPVNCPSPVPQLNHDQP